MGQWRSYRGNRMGRRGELILGIAIGVITGLAIGFGGGL